MRLFQLIFSGGSKMITTSSVSLLGFCILLGSVTTGLRRPFPFAYAVGHAALFAVMLHWWQINGGTARGLFHCTRPSTPSIHVGAGKLLGCEGFLLELSRTFPKKTRKSDLQKIQKKLCM